MSFKPTVLVVDDEFSIRESFGLILSSDYNLLQAASGEGALKQVADNVVDLTYLDIRMPGMNGIETLKRIKEISPQTHVIMVTAVNDVQQASEAIKLGAYDYVVKPFDVEKIINTTKEVLRRRGLVSLTRSLISAKTPSLVGVSQNIDEISDQIEKVAKTRKNVFILGEKGTEKEWIARLIYDISEEESPFIFYGLKGKSLSLMEKELLGENSGDTTVDLQKSSGILSQAGVLYIEDIDLLPKNLQGKLKSANIRVISSSQFDFSEEFDKELSQKLSEEKIKILPLRERASDVPFLIDYYSSEFKIKHKTKVRDLLPRAKNVLSSYNWPGNNEELKTVLEKIMVSTDSAVVDLQNIPVRIIVGSINAPSMPIDEIYSEFEKEFIGKVMEFSSNDKEAASKILNVQPNVLEIKLSS